MRAYPDIEIAWQRLATYLGAQFRRDLTDFDALRVFLDREWDCLTPNFYDHSIGYLYDLTHFHYMGIKDTFFRFLQGFASEAGITDFADVGCGVALDVQALLARGYDVHGYDLDNPCLDYARWRLGRDLADFGRIHTLDQLVDRRHQLAYAVDVLGHADDPPRLIKMIFASADYVCLNLTPHDRRHRHGSADLHPSLDHQTVLEDLAKHGDLIRLGAQDANVITLWRSAVQH